MSEETISATQLLKTRRFLPLFITQFMGALNDNIIKNGLVALITFVITTSEAGQLNLIIPALFILPFFLFSALAGQMADNYDKARMMQAIKIMEIGIVLIATAGFCYTSIPLLMVVIFMMGVHSTFFGPLKYAVLPQHLGEDELLSGNSQIEAGTFLAILIGIILGGSLIVTAHGAVVLSSVAFIVAICGFAASLFIPSAPPAGEKMKINRHLMKETRDILVYAASDFTVKMTILGISWFWLIGATLLSLFPTYAKTLLYGDNQVLNLLLTVFSVGIGVGSVACNKLLKGKITIKYITFAAFGMSIFAILLYHDSARVLPKMHLQGLFEFLEHSSSWYIIFDLAALSICGGLYIVPLYALMQEASDPAYRSRIIAANNIVNSIFMVASAILSGVLLAIGLTIPQVFLVIALLNILVALYIGVEFPDTFLRPMMKWLFSKLFRVEVKGLEHYEEAGKRVLLIANHTSFIDAVLLVLFLPEKCVFAINTYIARLWWIQPFLHLTTTLAIDPVNPLAAKTMIDVLKNDQKMIIFPEGRITVTGSLMKIYEGPGMIADKAEAVLLPIRIDGAQYTYFSRLKHVRKHLFPKITITIQAPERLTVDDELKGRKRRSFVSRCLYDVMSDMMFETSDRHKTLFSSLIDASAMNGGSHPIIEDMQRTPINYRAMLTRSFILGKVLAKRTSQSEYVGLMMPGAAATVISFFALQAIGRIPALINFTTGSSNIIAAFKAASIKTLITSRRFIENAKLETLIEQLNEHVTICYLEDLRPEITWKDKLAGLIDGFFPEAAYQRLTYKPKASDPAVVLYTSGSEGVPKGVVLSHENIQANRYQAAARIDFHAEDIVFNALPLFHSFGLTAGTLLPILSGIKTFFYPSPLHYRIIPELVYDINATIVFGTDTFLAGYAKQAQPYDFYSVRYVFAGAEKLKDRTRAVWSEKFGLRIFEGYGITETSPVLAVNTPMHYKTGTVGRLMPGIKWQLEPVPGIEEGGRLHVSGPNILQGYLRDKEPGVIQTVNESLFGEGWYDTGDIVTIDEEGYVTICGRAKRFAKIGGEMISLGAVEEFLSRNFPDGMHAIITRADEKKGEQLVLVTTSALITKELILTKGKEQGLSTIALPGNVIIKDKLPLLGSGKIDYINLQKELN